MNIKLQKEIFYKIIKELDTLNQYLISNKIDEYKFAKFLNEEKYDINTNDLELYLCSLCGLVFNKEVMRIIISKEDINKFIILNFFNVVLSEINLKELEFEVI